MIFCYCYSSSNAANMKGGEVETNKQTVTVDKKKHILLCTRLKRVLLIPKAQMFSAWFC